MEPGPSHADHDCDMRNQLVRNSPGYGRGHNWMVCGQKEQGTSYDNIPSEWSKCNGYRTSSSTSLEISFTDNVIQLHHETGEDTVRETSSEEDNHLDTSTPKFKWGLHDYTELEFTQRAHSLVEIEGVKYVLPKWLRKARAGTIHILADDHLKQWPIGDGKCRISFVEHSPLRSWIDEVKNCSLVLNSNIVVLYLQKLHNVQHETLLRNRIAQICRTIQSVCSDCRIFICDTIPSATNSLLENQQIVAYNRILFKATQHVNRQVERVFYLSMNAHFADVYGATIQPVEKYYHAEELTQLGCMIFHSCLFREVGITEYTL